MVEQDPHTDQTRIHNTQFVCYKVDRDYLEKIQDDNAFAYGFTIKRPDSEKALGEIPFQIRIADDPEIISAADFHGGLFVMSSIKAVALQMALAAGLQWMNKTGQLTCDVFYDRNGHTETAD